jgi:hypothetical protein
MAAPKKLRNFKIKHLVFVEIGVNRVNNLHTIDCVSFIILSILLLLFATPWPLSSRATPLLSPLVKSLRLLIVTCIIFV